MNSYLFCAAIFLSLQVMPITSYGCETVEATCLYPEVGSYSDWKIEDLLTEAEDALVQVDYQISQEKFSEAIELCKSLPSQEKRLFRALYGRVLSSACLNLQRECLADLEDLNLLIDSFKCQKVDINDEQSKEGSGHIANGKPILGPDEISKEKCVEIVKNTLEYSEKIFY